MQRLPWHPPWVSLYSKNRIIQSLAHLLLGGRCASSIWGDAWLCSPGLSQAVKLQRAHSRNVLTRGNFGLRSFFRSKRFSLLQSGLNIQSSGWSDPAYTSVTAHAPRVREGVQRREGGRAKPRDIFPPDPRYPRKPAQCPSGCQRRLPANCPHPSLC